MKIDKNFFNQLKKKKVNLITIDGITCSGKSLFTELLKKNLQNKFSDIYILSKDLFLFSRLKRINITKNIDKVNIDQNLLHYDIYKLKLLLNFLLGKTKKIF